MGIMSIGNIARDVNAKWTVKKIYYALEMGSSDLKWQMKYISGYGLENCEKTREFQSIQSKIRKIGMRKTRKGRGEPCILDISQQNATLKKRANFRVAYDSLKDD